MDERDRLELEYWRHLLDDLLAMNDAIGKTAGHTAEVPSRIVESMLAPAGESGIKLILACRAAERAMADLHSIHAPMYRLLALVDGRVSALTGSEPEHSVRVDP